jgi:hypothetical protein
VPLHSSPEIFAYAKGKRIVARKRYIMTGWYECSWINATMKSMQVEWWMRKLD